MRRIRGSFHLALTIVGTTMVLHAAVGIDDMRHRVLIALLGLVFIQAGIWRVTQSLFPNERVYRPLRKETDYFIVLVRKLNKSSVASRRGSAAAAATLEEVREEMHHSVERMVRLAGLTEEELGFRYSPRKKSQLPADERLAASG